MTMHVEGDPVVGKGNMRMPGWRYRGAYRAIDELGELRSLKVDKLIEVIYQDPVQLRAVNSGNEVLQILASTIEFKVGESREDRPCYGRHVYSIRAGSS